MKCRVTEYVGKSYIEILTFVFIHLVILARYLSRNIDSTFQMHFDFIIIIVLSYKLNGVNGKIPDMISKLFLFIVDVIAFILINLILKILIKNGIL